MAGNIIFCCHHGTSDDNAFDTTVAVTIVSAISAISIRQSGIPGPFVQKCLVHIDDRWTAITHRLIAVMIISAIFCITVMPAMALGISPVITGFFAVTLMATIVTAGFVAFG